MAERIHVRCTSDSAPIEHQAVRTVTASEVAVPLNVSTFPASEDDPLHVLDYEKVKILYVDVDCIKMTNVLLKMLEVQKAHLLYTWVSSPWSDKVVLCSTSRWSQVLHKLCLVMSITRGTGWHHIY